MLELHTHVRRYGRDYFKVITLRRSDWPKSVATWMWPLLSDLCTSSRLTPISGMRWGRLHSGLSVLHALSEWRTFHRKDVSDLDPECLARLFAQLDEKLAGQYSAYQANRISIQTRGAIRQYLAALNPRGRFARISTTFATKLREPRNKGRGLISDLVIGDQGELQPPVDALRHGTAADQAKKTLERLEGDLAGVQAACLRELDEYESSVARLNAYRSEEVDDHLVGRWERGFITRHRLLRSDEARQLARIYLRVDAGLIPRPAFAKREYVLSDQVAPHLCKLLNISEVPLECALRWDLYPPRTVLVACLLLLTIKTRWNVSSVIDLSSDAANRSRTPFQIQSFKNKTGDTTPPILVEDSDVGAVRALALLERRLALLKSRRSVPDNLDLLWISPRREKATGRAVQISSWHQALRIFQAKYRLPAFSFEQVRNQGLTIATLKSGGLIAAMESAGHSSIATLTTYVQGLITDRLHASTNLEFQRRWDAAIRYRLAPDTVDPGTRIIPIGDGASCANPALPPDDSWLNLGICEATNCHDGAGCPNRRLVIDEARVEEVVRTKRFYAAEWQGLLGRNPDAFLKNHLPAMLFNLVLFDALKRGPYRHLVAKHG